MWEKDFTTSNNFGRLKPLDLGVGRVEIWWEEREGRGESGEGKVSSIMRVVGGWPHLLKLQTYQWRTREAVRHRCESHQWRTKFLYATYVLPM